MLPDEFPLTSHVDFQDHATSKCMIKLDSRSLLISWQAREASNPPAFVWGMLPLRQPVPRFNFKHKWLDWIRSTVSTFTSDFPSKIFGPDPWVFQGKELLQLFGAYGTVTSCRLPKKADYSGHRGLAFKHRNQQTELLPTPGTPYVLALRAYIYIYNKRCRCLQNIECMSKKDESNLR